MTPDARTHDDRLLGLEGPGPLAVAWRDRWRVLAIGLVAAALTYGASSQATPVYSAETTLAFPYTNSEVALPGGDAERSRSLRTEAERMTSLALLEQAADAMGDGVDTTDLELRIEALPSSDSDVVTVRAVAATPDEAVEIADAVATAYRQQVDQRQETSIVDLRQRRKTLQQRIAKQQTKLAAQLQNTAIGDAADTEVEEAPSIASARLALEASVAQLSDVQARLDEVSAERESSVGQIQVLRPATLPEGPERPRPVRDAATVMLLAVLTFVTVRWWRADPEPPRVDEAQTVASVLGAPVIAEVHDVRRSPVAAGVVLDDFPQVVDAYRMAAAMTPLQGSVLVTAAQPGETCSDLVLNVGVELSRDGYRVVLVEGDPLIGRLRRSRPSDERGLTDVAAGRTELDDCVLRGAGDVNSRMVLLPWGHGSSSLPRGAGSGLSDALRDLRGLADLVLIDGPPLASSANALNLAANVDGILLLVTIGTPLAELSRLRARLAQLDRPVIGVVVQHATPHRYVGRRRRIATAPVQWARQDRARPRGSGG